MRTIGSRIPRLNHISFFCWCPMISFLRALSAIICSGGDLEFLICASIGGEDCLAILSKCASDIGAVVKELQLKSRNAFVCLSRDI
jgi:hypothetical protein